MLLSFSFSASTDKEAKYFSLGLCARLGSLV